MPDVKEYIDQSGQNHYRQFFNALPPIPAAKVATVVARLASGHTSGLKSLGGGLAEWRLDWGPGIRIYLHQDGPLLVLLMAGSDKGDQQKTIRQAHDLVGEYKVRKKVEKTSAMQPQAGKPKKRK